MKQRVSLFLCAAVFVCVTPHLARAQNNAIGNSMDAQSTHSIADPTQAQLEAAQMVPASAKLLTTVDARKSHAGEEVRAELRRNVQLKNGPDLPNGTMLVGTVTTDQTEPGNVKLALRFDEAKLKDGKTEPVKAMIVDIQPVNQFSYGSSSNLVPARDLWNPNEHTVDAVGMVSGADLHSSITSNDSAVVSSSKRNDVMIDAGSIIDMAISKQSAHLTN